MCCGVSGTGIGKQTTRQVYRRDAGFDVHEMVFWERDLIRKARVRPGVNHLLPPLPFWYSPISPELIRCDIETKV